MFLWTEVRYQLFRNKGRSVLMILASLFLLGSMAFYLGGMQRNETALRELGNKIPVRVVVVSPTGSNSAGLFIHVSRFDQLSDAGVRDVRATTAAAGALSEDAKRQEPFMGGDVTIVGVNSVRAIPLSQVEYTYASGFDETLFAGADPCCVLEQNFAESNGFSIGDNLTLPVYFYPRGLGEYVEMGEKTLKIAGTFSAPKTSGYSMLVPAGWLRAEAEAQEMKYFGFDSLSMVVDNPLHLNEFKDKLTEIGMDEIIRESDDGITGSAAVVQDEIYTKTANQFREIIQIYRGFLIPFFILIAGLSSLMTFLVLRGSRREMAIASSLGKNNRKIRLSYLLVILILYAIGCCCALPFILLFAGLGVTGAVSLSALFLCVGMAGAYLALILLLRFDTMELLTKVD